MSQPTTKWRAVPTPVQVMLKTRRDYFSKADAMDLADIVGTKKPSIEPTKLAELTDRLNDIAVKFILDYGTAHGSTAPGDQARWCEEAADTCAAFHRLPQLRSR